MEKLFRLLFIGDVILPASCIHERIEVDKHSLVDVSSEE